MGTTHTYRYISVPAKPALTLLNGYTINIGLSSADGILYANGVTQSGRNSRNVTFCDGFSTLTSTVKLTGLRGYKSNFTYTTLTDGKSYSLNNFIFVTYGVTTSSSYTVTLT